MGLLVSRKLRTVGRPEKIIFKVGLRLYLWLKFFYLLIKKG